MNYHKTGLAPAFESQPRAIEAVDCIPLEDQEGLYLLPGHVGLAEYEVTLGIAQELSGSILLSIIENSLLNQLNNTAWLEDEIRQRLSYQSFQQSDKIADAIR